MQNRGAIKFFAIAFALVCLYQLSFTFFAYRAEGNAKDYAVNETAQQLAKDLANGDEVLESYLFDSISQKKRKILSRQHCKCCCV
jgi:SecD/SecF fusion protein